MNLGLLAVFATGMVLHKKADPNTAQLGSLMAAGALVAIASKGD